MSAGSDGRYLARHGERIAQNGYLIVPIVPGTKRPPFEDWQGIRATPATVRAWVGNGQAAAGVGIISATTPAIDIDVRDEAAAAYMQSWCEKHIANTPVRYGQWPKRLLLFRTSKPFRKVTSSSAQRS